MYDKNCTPIVSTTALIERFKRDFNRDILFISFNEQTFLIYCSKNGEKTINNDIKNWLIAHGVLHATPIDVIELFIRNEQIESTFKVMQAENKLNTIIIIIMIMFIIMMIFFVIFR